MDPGTRTRREPWRIEPLGSLGARSLVTVLAALLGGCVGSYIESTEIRDTEDNRAIYDLVLAYRKAVEQRDNEALGGMVSNRYYENAGTTERTNDDYGFDALENKVFPLLRENIKAVQYSILMREIHVDGDQAWADFEFYANFKYVEGGEVAWDRKNDFNRMEFVRESGHWKIVAGL
jgi:hypothetical protein